MLTRAMQIVVIFGLVGASRLASQTPSGGYNWEFDTRLLVTGSSHGSEPDGYTMYTAFPIEVAVRRTLSRRFCLELALRNESREVDKSATPEAVRVGSIEFLPTYLLLQYHLRTTGTWRPYLGLGVNATIAWEKAGTLDSMNVSPSVGPAVQAGVDIELKSYLALNADFRWNTFTTTVEPDGGPTLAKIKVDPSSLGFGVAVRF